MKLKITFLALFFGLPIFAFAATQYAPARTALRAQASDSTAAMMAEYYKKYSVIAPAAPVPSAIPAYMMQVPQYTAPTSYVVPSMAPISAPSAQPNAASSNNVVAENVVTAKEVVADKGSFKEGKFGLASVYIGSDTVGNYIKATGTATKNFLRIMFGTTASNAVEKVRITANGFIGIGTTNPTQPLEVSGTVKATSIDTTNIHTNNIITATINPHSAGLGIRTNEISVSSGFCLPDGTKTPLANPNNVTDSEWLSMKCFQYACPAANGQWTLSQTTCPVAVIPKPTLFLPGSTTIVSRSRQVNDDIASLEWGATAGGVSIKTVKLNFSGAAISRATSTTTTPASAFSVALIDASTTVAWASTSQQVCSPSIGGVCSVTFSPNAVIPQGVRTKKVFVRVNSSLFTNGALQDSLSVQMNTASDITWSDGVTSSINWNPVEMPMTAANIYYP